MVIVGPGTLQPICFNVFSLNGFFFFGFSINRFATNYFNSKITILSSSPARKILEFHLPHHRYRHARTGHTGSVMLGYVRLCSVMLGYVRLPVHAYTAIYNYYFFYNPSAARFNYQTKYYRVRRSRPEQNGT